MRHRLEPVAHQPFRRRDYKYILSHQERNTEERVWRSPVSLRIF